MKNNKKISLILGLVIIIIIVIAGGFYVFNKEKVCHITDSDGKIIYGPCPENKAGYLFNADDNTDLGRLKK